MREFAGHSGSDRYRGAQRHIDLPDHGTHGGTDHVDIGADDHDLTAPDCLTDNTDAADRHAGLLHR
jgi:hypothetical protein